MYLVNTSFAFNMQFIQLATLATLSWIKELSGRGSTLLAVMPRHREYCDTSYW